MARFALDSSCMVAGVSSWHTRHEAVAGAIGERLDRGEQLVVAGHALAEAYSVLTRLPAPHRLSAPDAWSLLRVNFAETAVVTALDGPRYVQLIGEMVELGVRGGRIYDSIIGACAEQARVAELLTLNARHFDPPPTGVLVVDLSD